jgi:hypothetical protein
MLSASTLPRRVAPLERLEATDAPPHVTRAEWNAPIDRARWFFCETLTPLYYTRTYATLTPEHRRRYNQLTGMLSNELILHLETGFLDGVLDAIARRRCEGADADIIQALGLFRDDERRHADQWRQLNRLSAPEWYRAADRYLLCVPTAVHAIARALARHPVACPIVFWIQLAQEERSIEISRRCLRMPSDQIEPRYAAVYGQHLRDEVRHVQVDCHLIQRFYASQPLAARRLTATIFRWVLANLFLRPTRSTVRVVHVLASEFPELRSVVPQAVRELRALTADESYQQMMYSRLATPITFEMFDRFPEFHSMSRVLRAYAPAPIAARP